ncbi:MAG: tetratricopeptide repeat protein [Caldilineaceae bacterium]|nr:tetratricopeptide repeat protein [Caldilineaceae bacterium]
MTNTQTKLGAWCTGLIEAAWLAALTLAPLFFNVYSSRVFEPDKITLIRTAALVTLVAWIIRWVDSGRLWLPVSDNPAVSASWRKTPFLLPMGLLVIAYLVSTLFSVAPFVSWFGSYQRLQGTYTFLAYVTIALAVMAHLRHDEQIRRLRHVIIITSLPIAIYGMLQHMGLDPLPWGGDVQTRIASTAGNAIFLAAYLLMAFFFTLERVFSSFAHLLRSDETEDGEPDSANIESQDIPTALAGGAYLFILMVQLLAIFWTQSRGPVLGLLAGLYLFVLLLFSALRPRGYRIFTSAWVGAGLLGVVMLFLLNTTTLFSGVHSIDSLARLSTLLDLESNTAQVRINIWQGAADMVAPHPPLVQPDGTTDRLNPIRPLVGYGPETMWVAYNPFYPVTLGHYESRNASPDRSHNETWDALIITGLLGFLAYMWLFIAIFYWSLRWLGLLVNRRDQILFGALLGLSSLAFVISFYYFDNSWRYLGVALPAGLILGLAVYITMAAFLHEDDPETQRDFPRQILLITLLVTMVAHFVEIHFGIAIAATRTYFWVMTGLLLVTGMGWVQPEAYAVIDDPAEEAAASSTESKSRRRTQQKRRPRQALPVTSSTVMTDLLIFLTLTFTFTTNSAGLENPFAILRNSVFNTDLLARPAIFLLLIFTWLVAVTVGMTTESLRHRYLPQWSWWLKGYLVHGLIVWGGWLIYGLMQSRRLIPGLAGTGLDEQLNFLAGHFALFTWLVILWTLAAATVYSRPILRSRAAAAIRLLPSLAAGVAAAALALFLIITVNIGLVRADVIYKQGQQFDSQRSWATSIELYKRALASRTTEDHYMLFLGRALLERAKEVEPNNTSLLGEAPTLDSVLALDQTAIAQLSQEDLLRAAEAVLLQAQRVNPLNTDHTANLARLYRTWSDLTDNEAEAEAMLNKSLAMYATTVQLSPHNVRLWNENANAHLARGERDVAETIYTENLQRDDLYDETYVLLADMYSRRGDDQAAIDLLETGVEKLSASPARRVHPSLQMYSYLSVAYAKTGQLEKAIAANQEILQRDPNNLVALRNTAIIYRDLGDETGDAAAYVKGIEAVNQGLAVAGRGTDLRDLHQVAVELNQRLGDNEALIQHYQALYDLTGDANALRNLYNTALKTEDWTTAVGALTELVALEPDDYHHPLALAQILYQTGDAAGALPYAEQALALAPAEEQAAITELVALLQSDADATD